MKKTIVFLHKEKAGALANTGFMKGMRGRMKKTYDRNISAGKGSRKTAEMGFG